MSGKVITIGIACVLSFSAWVLASVSGAFILFAELDAAGWAVVLGSGFLGLTGTLTSVLGLILAYLEKKNTVAREDAREAARIERNRIAEEKAEVREREQFERDKKIGEKVEVIHLATNSMKDALMVKTEDEALARGALKERDRAETKIEAKEAAAAVLPTPASPPPSEESSSAHNVKRAAIDAIRGIEGVAKAVEEVPAKTADLVDEQAEVREKKKP